VGPKRGIPSPAYSTALSLWNDGMRASIATLNAIVVSHTVNTGGEKHFLGVGRSAKPVSQGAVPLHPPNVLDLLHALTRNEKQ